MGTRISILYLAIALSCSYCHPRSKHPENHSFYYWKSNFSLTATDRSYLNALQVNRLYVRFFDVTWDAERAKATPTAPINFTDTSYLRYSIVPVIFITNDVLAQLDTTQVAPLAEHIAKLVTQLQQNSRLKPPDELQLDADWSSRTKDRYFSLLTGIRQWLDKNGEASCKLSATIRLYQCKYRDQAGIPPVQKGLLMCYNMGDLKKTKTHNSILETTELEKYTRDLNSYPLPLDVAFPIFNWKVYFHDAHYAGLIESLPTQTLNNATVEKTDNLYTFKKDTNLNGYQFEPGDQLRDEQSNSEALQATSKIIARKLKAKPENILLFHLDSANLTNYTPDELENIFDHFN
jgi:hypothetical protein